MTVVFSHRDPPSRMSSDGIQCATRRPTFGSQYLAGGMPLMPRDDFGWPTLCGFVFRKGWVRSSLLTLADPPMPAVSTFPAASSFRFPFPDAQSWFVQLSTIQHLTAPFE